MAGTARFHKFSSIANGDMSGAINGTQFDISGLIYIGAHVIWTNGSTPSGTVRIQVSNDNGVTWTNYGGTVVPSGASGSGIIAAFTDWVNPFHLVRGRYDFTSGSGTLQVIISGKK